MAFNLETGEEIVFEKESMKHWKGMPDYPPDFEKEYAMVICRFETKEDFEDFQVRLGQKINLVEGKVKPMWHPKRKIADTLDVFFND